MNLDLRTLIFKKKSSSAFLLGKHKIRPRLYFFFYFILNSAHSFGCIVLADHLMNL
jgi:hypothetical protein